MLKLCVSVNCLPASKVTKNVQKHVRRSKFLDREKHHEAVDWFNQLFFFPHDGLKREIGKKDQASLAENAQPKMLWEPACLIASQDPCVTLFCQRELRCKNYRRACFPVWWALRSQIQSTRIGKIGGKKVGNKEKEAEQSRPHLEPLRPPCGVLNTHEDITTTLSYAVKKADMGKKNC